MPRGDKSSYTDKQKRKAEHIEEGYEDRGVGKEEAERRAWATVNKESGGGKSRKRAQGRPQGRVQPDTCRALGRGQERLGNPPTPGQRLMSPIARCAMNEKSTAGGTHAPPAVTAMVRRFRARRSN